MTRPARASQTQPAALESWQGTVRGFKERLAQRLWALPGVSETEKELLFKEYLVDLDEVERSISAFVEDTLARGNGLQDENALLRSLLGVGEEDLRAQMVGVGQELQSAQRALEALREEAEELRQQLSDTTEENRVLRQKVQFWEKEQIKSRLENLQLREGDIRFLSETQEVLRAQAEDLQARITDMRSLYAEANEQLVREKQEEIAALQKKLLDEMGETLRRRQQLSWAEENLFAKGVAARVRNALVSAQGQLYYTLERLGLLDPETKSMKPWKGRLRLFVEGSEELLANFQSVQALFHEVVGALDDYLHLTGRREISAVPVDLAKVVQEMLGEVYRERRPTVSIEILADDPLPSVTGDEPLIGFLLRTLIQNALEALPDGGGALVISLRHRTDLGYVEVMVQDSGRGIPHHLAGRLFQPFFTTKDGRQGLNLSRARRYAEFHQGQLELVTTGPEGTTFRLVLPLSPTGMGPFEGPPPDALERPLSLPPAPERGDTEGR